MYQEATREPYSFWFIHYLKDKANMFYKRWEERFLVDGAEEAAQPVNGGLPIGGDQQAAGGGPIIESECSNIRCCSSSQPPNVYDPAGHAANGVGPAGRVRRGPRPVRSPGRPSALGERSKAW